MESSRWLSESASVTTGSIRKQTPPRQGWRIRRPSGARPLLPLGPGVTLALTPGYFPHSPPGKNGKTAATAGQLSEPPKK